MEEELLKLIEKISSVKMPSGRPLLRADPRRLELWKYLDHRNRNWKLLWDGDRVVYTYAVLPFFRTVANIAGLVERLYVDDPPRLAIVDAMGVLSERSLWRIFDSMVEWLEPGGLRECRGEEAEVYVDGANVIMKFGDCEKIMGFIMTKKEELEEAIRPYSYTEGKCVVKGDDLLRMAVALHVHPSTRRLIDVDAVKEVLRPMLDVAVHVRSQIIHGFLIEAIREASLLVSPRYLAEYLFLEIEWVAKRMGMKPEEALACVYSQIGDAKISDVEYVKRRLSEVHKADPMRFYEAVKRCVTAEGAEKER